MKVLSLIGTRPQYIKEAILNQEFKNKGINEILVDSGQHYDSNMSGIFLSSLNINKPDYNLNIGSGTHAEATAGIMIKFEKVIEKVKPDLILVYGDTNTTLAGAIVAAKLKIKLAHIEAGMRSLPKNSPEEINRVLTDRISDLLFCPSKSAVKNLKLENIRNNVYYVGDVMYDLYSILKNKISGNILKKLNLFENEYIVVTLHRDFNVDNKEKLKTILNELKKINKEIKIVFTVHPRTKQRIKDFNLEKLLKGFIILEPLDYLNLSGLVKYSKLVITDSGGLQKEAYFAGKRAIVVMPDTAWIELIINKLNILSDEYNIYNTFLKNSKYNYVPNIYGDGKSGEKIVDYIVKLIK